MIRVVTLTLSLVMLSGALSFRAHAAAPQNAQEEAARRQAAIIETRLALEKAQTVARQGDLPKALKSYSDAYTAALKVSGPGIEPEMREIIAGLSAVKIELAQIAAQKGDYKTALDQLGGVLKIAPQNGTAISLNQSYEKAAEQARGRQPSPEVQAMVPVVTEEKVKTSTLVQDGKLLFELGKYEEAIVKLRQAIKQDPGNAAAFYYMDLIANAKYGDAARKREISSKEALVQVEVAQQKPTQRDLLPQPNPMARTNLIFTGSGRQQIYQKLNDIRIPEVLLDGLPLSEVIKFLNDEIKRQDPLKRGINFILNSFVDAGSGAGVVTVDPATGAAIPSAPVDPINLETVTIKLNPALVDIRLADLMDAITKVADKPIKFSVEDYAIVFSQKRPEAVHMTTRQFKVDPNTFMQGLESVTGIPFTAAAGSSGGQGGGGGGGGGARGGGGGGQGGQGGQEDGGLVIPRVSIAGISAQGGGGAGGGGQGGDGVLNVTVTNLTQAVQETARQFFIAAGVNLAPPANVFWNDRAGILLVRASLEDLDLVEQAIQVLNTAPPQVTIEAKFAEINQNDTKAIGFDWFVGGTSLGSGGKIVAGAGTSPSLNGRSSAANPSGIFPGAPGTPNIITPNGSLIGAQAQTLIPQAATDGLLSGGLRNSVGTQMRTIPALASITGILTDPQFKVVIRAIEQRSGVDLLSAPRVTTLSGRQTQIAVVDVITIVTGQNFQQGNANNNQQQTVVTPGTFSAGVVGTTSNYDTDSLPFGPVLDVIPYVSADGYTIQMTIIPTLTEFLGYDDPGAFVPEAQSAAGNNIGTPITAQLPLPRFRSRQLATSAIVWDGQTLVLGGLIAEDVAKIKDKVPVLGDLPFFGRFFRTEGRSSSKKNLVIFVTPTIIDPAGNRVNSDADLPFTRPTTAAR